MRFAALLASLSLAVAGVWVTSPSAGAAVTDGLCTTDTGVTLVVDYQELGGRILKCVDDVPAGTSGLQLLKLAGVTAEGTIHDGPSFVCRLNGRPSATENLPVTGSPDYRETCVTTPSQTAFWSYWYSSDGEDWTFAQMGGASREVVPGGYEGWSFSLNNTDTTNPPPDMSRSHTANGSEPDSNVATQAQDAPPVSGTVGSDGGPPVGTLIGVGAVASLGAGGGLVWWRRRSL